jgi:DNA-binding CsgD family transcriptional regulator
MPERSLSSQERRVLEGLAALSSTEAVAVELGLDPATVRSRLRTAMKKLGVRTHAEAIAVARGRAEID